MILFGHLTRRREGAGLAGMTGKLYGLYAQSIYVVALGGLCRHLRHLCTTTSATAARLECGRLRVLQTATADTNRPCQDLQQPRILVFRLCWLRSLRQVFSKQDSQNWIEEFLPGLSCHTEVGCTTLHSNVNVLNCNWNVHMIPRFVNRHA